MEKIFGPLLMVGLGPFTVQGSRIFLYLAYFVTGTAFGAYGFERGLLKRNGIFAKRWWFWSSIGLVVFIISLNLGLSGFPFVISGVTISLGTMAIFLHFAISKNRFLDSLSANAYGIFKFHSMFIWWLQYVLLDTPLSAFIKGMLVFLLTLILSCGLSAPLRRIRLVVKII